MARWRQALELAMSREDIESLIKPRVFGLTRTGEHGVARPTGCSTSG
jgi:hypothetical protein